MGWAGLAGVTGRAQWNMGEMREAAVPRKPWGGEGRQKGGHR